MAFQDYLDLRTAVIEETGRAEIADRFDRYVQLCEARMNRELRTRFQIVHSTLTFSGGYASVPGDLLHPIALYDASGCEMGAVTYSQTGRTPLRGEYVIAGDNVVGPDEGVYTFQYYAQIPSITDQAANATDDAHISGASGIGTYPNLSGTNWVLQRYPAAYLYGAATEVERSARNAESAQAADALFRQEIASIRRDDGLARYARARVKTAGVTP